MIVGDKKFQRRDYSSLIIKYLVFSYGLGLFVGLTLYVILSFNEMFRNTLLIGFILSIGLVVIPYAHEFKYHTTKLIGDDFQYMCHD